MRIASEHSRRGAQCLDYKADRAQQPDLPIPVQVESPGKSKICFDQARHQNARMAAATQETTPSRLLDFEVEAMLSAPIEHRRRLLHEPAPKPVREPIQP